MKFNVDDIIRNTDLLALVELAGGKMSKSGRSWSCACPIHGGTNPNGFNVYTGKNGLRWKCFTDSCGGGDSISFVMKWQKIDFMRACQYLTGDNGIDPVQMAEISAQRSEWLKKENEERERIAQETIKQIENDKRWLTYSDYLKNNEDAIRLWLRAGIPQEWQYLWQLGYDPEFKYWIRKTRQEHISPSLTIPLFSSGWQCSNIRHRILNPVDPKDKYRPEYFGVESEPFIADPDLPKGEGKMLIVLEGEKKGMVTYLTLDIPGSQVIGIPGMKWNKDGALKAFGTNIDEIYICYDPGATKEAEEAAELFDGRARVLDLPYKLDDMIVQYKLDKLAVRGLLSGARKLK
jgi:DNA primase